MRWLRQHSEDGQVFLVARIGGERGRYVISLLHPSGASRAGAVASTYTTPEAAFAAADALVRSRHGDHTCSSDCSGWSEDARPALSATTDADVEPRAPDRTMVDTRRRAGCPVSSDQMFSLR